MPQRAAGMRMEPPVSLPVVMVHWPAAVAEPEPPLEPPLTPLGVPGVVHMAVVGVLAGGAIGELVHIQLAQQDGPGLAESGGHSAVLGGYEGVEDAGAGGGADAASVEEVFQSHGDAVERAAVAPGADVALGLPGGGQGLVGQQGDEGVQPRLGGSDTGQVGLDDFDGRDFAIADSATEVGGAHVADFEFVHDLTPVIG